MNTAPPRRRVALPESNMLPRVGKIRLGMQVPTKEGDRLRPTAIDYFRVDVDESGITTAGAVEAFREVYGDEPRELHCTFAGDTPEDVLEGAYRLYGASKLKRKCDGESCDERTTTGGWEVDKPCVCKARGIDEAHKDHCTLTYTLQVLLPNVRGVGVWQLDSGSEISVRNMAAFARMIYHLRGSLAMYEFALGLKEVKVAPKGVSKTVHVLDPRAYSATPAEMLAAAAERAAVPPAIHPVRGLPAPIADDARDELLDPPDGHLDESPDAATPGPGGPGDLVEAVGRGLKALSTDDRAELRRLLEAHGVVDGSDGTVGAIARKAIEEYGEPALDVPAMLRHLRSAPLPAEQTSIAEVDQAAGAAAFQGYIDETFAEHKDPA